MAELTEARLSAIEARRDTFDWKHIAGHRELGVAVSCCTYGDVTDLLAEVRRLARELAEANKRIEALRGVSIEHHLGESGTMICLNCGTEWEVDGPEAHGEDCPVAPKEAKP